MSDIEGIILNELRNFVTITPMGNGDGEYFDEPMIDGDEEELRAIAKAISEKLASGKI